MTRCAYVPFTALLLLCLLPCAAAAEDVASDAAPPLFQIYFAPPSLTPESAISVIPGSKDTRFRWQGTGLGVRDRGGIVLVNRSILFGTEGEFTAGLDNGAYKLEMVFGDKGFPHGPFKVFVQGRLVGSMTTQTDKFVKRTFDAVVTDEKLRIKIVAQPPANFAATSLTIYGPEQTKEHSVYGQRPPERKVPTAAEIDAKPMPDLEAALKNNCDWLLLQQLPNGFFKQNSGEWYRTAYAVRALIACNDVLHDARYLGAATKSLDAFVAEQLPNGAWANTFLNRPTAASTPQQLKAAMFGTTNLADVGCMSVNLAFAYHAVDAARQQRYRAALKRYADEYAAPYQLDTGAFPNARWGGQIMLSPYSVATGTQAMSFAGLAAITGDEKYIKIAERAALFLANSWRPDGEVIHHQHNVDEAVERPATAFGDIFYYIEGMLWTWHHTKDESVKSKISDALGWYVNGKSGLMAALDNGVWWPITDADWVNCKAPGMVQAPLEYEHLMNPNPGLRTMVERELKFLANPEYASRVGVQLDPDAPWGTMSVMATSLASLTLADVAAPGSIFLRAESASQYSNIGQKPDSR